jgi:hypothetical protein
MYGLSRMALDNLIDDEALSLSAVCMGLAPIAAIALADGNEELGKAVANIARLRIVAYLTIWDEVALPWKLTLDPERLQVVFNRADDVFGRWWTQANKNQLAFLLHEVMTRAMEYNEELEKGNG